MKLKSLLENKKRKLKDWVPYEFKSEFSDTQAAKYLDWDIVEEMDDYKNPFKRKNIYTWVIITNNKKYKAVGWNENPATGWSFPVISIKEDDIEKFKKYKN